MAISEFTRVCSACQQEKSFSEFYLRSEQIHSGNPPTLPGHVTSECKVCMNARSKAKRMDSRKSLGPHRATEELVIKALARQGIPALAGKVFISAYPNVDVVAWGCVMIEVKWAKLDVYRGVEKFKFNATPTQKRKGFSAHLIILVCEYVPDEYTYHVFPVEHPVFYKDGHTKTGWTFTPGAYEAKKHGNNRMVMTQPLMDEFQDRWGLVQAKRLLIGEALYQQNLG